MKKKMIASAAMSMALVAAMGSTAFAATKTDGAGTSADPVYVYGADFNEVVTPGTIDVTGGVTDNNTADTVAKKYYVEVSWATNSKLQYTYGTDAYTWEVYDMNSDKITDLTKKTPAAKAGYEFNAEGGTWNGSATVTVSVKNWSNAAVYSKLSAAGAVEGMMDVKNNEAKKIAALSDSVTFTKGASTTAENRAVATAVTDTITINNADLKKGIAKDNDKVATVTVTLAGTEN